jgi:hypothetical protein
MLDIFFFVIDSSRSDKSLQKLPIGISANQTAFTDTSVSD